MLGRTPVVLAVALAAASSPSFADPLITFTDTEPNIASAAFLSDTSANWAVQWTQASASSNVTLSALILASVPETSVPANWYVTNAIGPGTTLANVVASGSYTSPVGNWCCDFNVLPRTVLGTGLDFAAGTYYLVLDGPPGQFLNNANWVGDDTAAIALAPGFSIGSYYSAAGIANFAPEGRFIAYDGEAQFVFEMETVKPAVPEPGSWALMIGGLMAAGAVMRRRPVAVRFA